MRTHVAALLLALMAAPAVRADTQFRRPLNGDCISLAGSSAVSLYPEQFMLQGEEHVKVQFYTQVTSSLGFDVKYFPTYKVVTNKLAVSEATPNGEVYVLVPCGVEPPSADAFPAGTKFFTVPLTSLSAPETVPYAFVEFLGLGDRVHDVSTYVTSPCGQALLACPGGGRASPDFSMLSNATYLDDTVASVTDGVMMTSPNPDYPDSFAVSAAQDPGVLNRAEWVKFVGLFFNKEQAASEVFDALKAEYEATKAAAANTAGAKKPVVAWAQFFSYPGMGASYQLSFDPYQTQYTQDAGGAMLDRAALAATPGVTSTDGSPTLSFGWGNPGAFETQEEARAAFLAVLKQADVIIDETYTDNPTTYTPDTLLKGWNLTEAAAAAVPAIANKKVFREDGLVSVSQVPDPMDPSKTVEQYGSDWFEGAIARPGQVLKDVVRAVQPNRAEANQGFTWLWNLATEKPAVKTAKDCGATAPCTAEPHTICPFVKVCAAGQAPALLETSTGGQCTYARCGSASAIDPTNAAAMAAPAVVLTLVVVAFVELLMHFC